MLHQWGINFEENGSCDQKCYYSNTSKIILFDFYSSFLGYCGAIKESRVLLTAYGLFIIIIALLQIAAIVLACIYRNQAENHTRDFFKHTIRKYYTTKSQRDAVTLSWDFMMAEVWYFSLKTIFLKVELTDLNKTQICRFLPYFFQLLFFYKNCVIAF